MKRKMILVVEDDPNVRGMIAQLVMSLEEKCDLIEVGSGEEALSSMKDRKPDLVILDIFLPGMNGFEFCQKVRSDVASRAVKILAITGYPEDDSIKKMYDAGADLCIMKPLHLDHFRRELERLLSE